MIFIGEISAMAAALFWAWNSVVLTEATHRIGSVNVNIARMFFASVFLLVTLFFVEGSFNISGSQYFNLVISGVVGLILGDTFLFKAFQTIGPRLGMLLMSLAPPIAAILAWIFLGEILSFAGITGIIVTLAGISVVILEKKPRKQGNKLNRKGVLYGVLAATGQGVGLIFAKQAFNEAPLNEFTASFVRLASAVIILYLMIRMQGKLKNPLKIFKGDKIAFKNTIYASILGPYLGITASMIAVANTYVGIASTLMSTVPILMIPISVFYYKEKLSWKSIAGTFVAVAGISILFLY